MAPNEFALTPDEPGQGESASEALSPTSYPAMQLDSAARLVLEILDQYAITLDTQRYPAALFAESIMYMVYWFHRQRDPLRKSSMERCIGNYLNVDPQSAVVKALLADESLRTLTRERIDQGVMVRKTVDVLVMREGPSGKEFLVLDRAFFPEGMALPGGLLHIPMKSATKNDRKPAICNESKSASRSNRKTAIDCAHD